MALEVMAIVIFATRMLCGCDCSSEGTHGCGAGDVDESLGSNSGSSA